MTWKHTFRYVVVTPWEVATPIFLNKEWHQEHVRKVQEIHTPKLIGGASEGGVTELSGNSEELRKDCQTVYMEWGTLSIMTRTCIYQGQSSVIMCNPYPLFCLLGTLLLLDFWMYCLGTSKWMPVLDLQEEQNWRWREWCLPQLWLQTLPRV